MPKVPCRFILLVVFAGCQTPDAAADFRVLPMDPHSHAEPSRIRVRHVELDLTVDFTARRLSGTATLTLERPDPEVADGAATLVLDRASTLVIDDVTALDTTPRAFEVGAVDPILGTALRLDVLPGDAAVVVHYHTEPEAAALQWLAPEQTDGGRLPFLFTQGQAILTRSWIPLQDSPSVRQTWAATIRTPAQPDLVAVMSADSRQVLAPGVTRFSMTRPVPSYLIALAIGELERREISERCAVFAEPAVVERAAAEFEDVDAMLTACERLYGPYRWGRYDLLVLPPSFPFGGMENPCLTFVTPTILAGDRSLVALIAHELAHSWSGNLVTNATWNDFWLNEGFTVYVEQRIVEALYGAERANAETLLGMQGLERELAALPEADQRLAIDLAGRDPDDGMTAVAYDKGAAFLRRLEQVFGRPRFEAFVRRWFDEHAFKSATTAEFRDYLQSELLAAEPALAAEIDVARWIDGAGLPDDAPRPEVAWFERVDLARTTWLDGGPVAELPGDGWTTPEWLHFLGGIPDDVDPELLAALDARFDLTATGNAEILSAWLLRNLRAGYAELPAPVEARLERFLVEIGRRKFLEPLYRALTATPDGAARARTIYATARPRYHAVTARTIDAIVTDR